jgi:PBP1b-binding outer membrane lipoprotein LpoB
MVFCMKAFLSLMILCIALILVAGCTNPIVTPPTTTPRTPTPTTSPVTMPDLQPQPTDIVPPNQQVAIQITKNTVATDPWVSVLFAGGSGQSYITVMNATIIRSDGIIETKSVSYPAGNTNIFLNGTTRTDRVIVNVSYTDGNTYTVKDELVPFK